MRESWRPNRTAIYWPPLLWPSALCLSRSPGLPNRRPGDSLCWVRAFSTASCHQRVSKLTGGPESLFGQVVAFSTTSCLRLLWSPTHWGPEGPFCRVVAFSSITCLQLLWSPTHWGPEGPFCRVVAFSSISCLRLLWSPNHWLPVSTELYNSSTAHSIFGMPVWSSSSGNNCHAVHRSLSSGASVSECTMGFLPCPTRFLFITSLGMCHFLPVHHFGMACLAGSKVNMQQLGESYSSVGMKSVYSTAPDDWASEKIEIDK